MLSGAFWILAGAVVLGSLFSTLHIALVDLARSALEEIATVRNRRSASERVERILEDVAGHAKSVAVVRVLCDGAAMLAMVWWVAGLRGGEEAVPGLTELAIGVAAGGAVLWVTSVALPMSAAYHVGETLVYTYSAVVRGAYIATGPLRTVSRFIDEVVRRLGGIQAGTHSEVVEQELLSAVEEAEREGHVDEAEAEMIEAVVEFRNLTVEQVMTPRTEIEAFESTDDLGAVTRIINKIGHSRIPVYEGNLDNVIGMFYVKDLMRWLAGEGTHGSGEPFALRRILRPALFVPETKTVRELLRELLQKKVHIAMVADEYGGTAGLVTIEDIVEEIVGEIRDEYEPEEEPKADVEVKPDEGMAEVDARAYIDDVNDRLQPLGWALPEGDDYDTVGGFVVTTLGRIPEQGETFRHDRATVTVLESSPTRVLRVRLEVRPETGGEPPAEAPPNGQTGAGGTDSEDLAR